MTTTHCLFTHPAWIDLPAEDQSLSGQIGPTICFVADEEDAGQRLDRFIPDKLKQMGEPISRSLLQEWIRSGLVTVAGKVAHKPRQAIHSGDEVCVSIPTEKPTELLAENIPLSVIFEDKHIIVINKECGLVVHPGAGNENGTLVNALLFHCDGNLSRVGEDDRPGIVHRLDKDTSGCLVAAKSDSAYRSLVAQFSSRTTGKEYLAIVDGIPFSKKGRIENRIGRHPVHRQRMTILEPPAGKEAVTEYQVEFSDEKAKWSRVRCRILTGRTHQIRVHMKESLRCAILGDPIYAKVSRQKTKVNRLMLHAEMLQIIHPETGKEMTFQSGVPAAFEKFT